MGRAGAVGIMASFRIASSLVAFDSASRASSYASFKSWYASSAAFNCSASSFSRGSFLVRYWVVAVSFWTAADNAPAFDVSFAISASFASLSLRSFW